MMIESGPETDRNIPKSKKNWRQEFLGKLRFG
jgi:hypothetical protein